MVDPEKKSDRATCDRKTLAKMIPSCIDAYCIVSFFLCFDWLPDGRVLAVISISFHFKTATYWSSQGRPKIRRKAIVPSRLWSAFVGQRRSRCMPSRAELRDRAEFCQTLFTTYRTTICLLSHSNHRTQKIAPSRRQTPCLP